MVSLSYLFERMGDQTNSLVKNFKYAFSPEGAENTVKGIVKGTKDLGKTIVHKTINLGDTVYDATHDTDSGASYGGLIFKTKKAMDLENANNAYKIVRGMPQFREREPERAAQWMNVAKKYLKQTRENK